MGEVLRLVEVKGVDQVARGQRRKGHQIVNVGIAAGGNDHRVLGRDLPQGGDDLGHQLPDRRRVVLLRLVERLEGHGGDRPARQRLRHAGPGLHQLFAGGGVGKQRVLVGRLWLQGQHHGQPGGAGGIQTGHQLIERSGAGHQPLGIDANAHVAEAQLPDQAQIVRANGRLRGDRFKRGAVGEPVTQVHAALQGVEQRARGRRGVAARWVINTSPQAPVPSSPMMPSRIR